MGRKQKRNSNRANKPANTQIKMRVGMMNEIPAEHLNNPEIFIPDVAIQLKWNGQGTLVFFNHKTRAVDVEPVLFDVPEKASAIEFLTAVGAGITRIAQAGAVQEAQAAMVNLYKKGAEA